MLMVRREARRCTSRQQRFATIDRERGAWSDQTGKYLRHHLWVLAGMKLKAGKSGAAMTARLHLSRRDGRAWLPPPEALLDTI